MSLIRDVVQRELRRIVESKLKPGYIEVEKAREYLAKAAKMKPNSAARTILKNLKPTQIHPTLSSVAGYSIKDLDDLATKIWKGRIDAVYKENQEKYDENFDLSKLKTKSYVFTRPYYSDGRPTQYMKIIKYIEENNFGTLLDLINTAKYGLDDHKFFDLNLEDPADEYKAISRYGGIIYRDFAGVGILKPSAGGEFSKGKNFDKYLKYVNAMRKSLESKGVEVKEF